MIEGKKILAVTLARGGSKGLKKKNIKDLCGKPLLAYTVLEAKKSKYIDRIILNSEDEEIINEGLKYGFEVPFKRPAELATDHTPSIDVILDLLNKVENEFDYILLLQPTSPLRSVEDIDGCIEKCLAENAKCCVSIVKSDKSPNWMYNFSGKELIPVNKEKLTLRRQDCPPVYVLNGAVYFAEKEFFVANKGFLSEETIGYEMSKRNSLDIDDIYDFYLAEAILKKEQEND